MTNAHLATYLNDHLAGATTVLELLTHLEATYADTDKGRFFAGLHADIAADGQELESLMERLHIGQSGPRKATAWLAEKITQFKLGLEDRGGGDFNLLECFEIMAVGIEGKRSLWRALAVASEAMPGLKGVDYDHLEQRAEEQRGRIEGERLKAARAAFLEIS